ncbi:DUF3592 domain-containing protein [Chitinophaga barathri]|uniref:DUF3592 domain-containing protein n=1 Tax=Chitinophaga barathri TaxID=1647451 RepID=A0A3N4MLG5_9BACT|nr:hypothetical protein [Chitinophaga barathri]RPD42827.1 hypothetical protein EG028_00575 [Chitinophaga barathri]
MSNKKKSGTRKKQGEKKPVEENVLDLSKMTFREKLKNIFYFLCILAGLFLVIYFIAMGALARKNEEIKKIEESNTSTTGTVISTGNMKGSYAVLEYVVDGKTYTKKQGSPSDHVQPGAHYMVLYDKGDPRECWVDYTSPLFLPDEQVEATEGEIIRKDSKKIGFAYTVKGERYEQFQRYKEGINIDKDKTYTVEYLAGKPKISIIRIDQ